MSACNSLDIISHSDITFIEENSVLSKNPNRPQEKSSFEVARDTIFSFAEIFGAKENRKIVGAVIVLTTSMMINRIIAPLLLGKVVEGFSSQEGKASLLGVSFAKSSLLTFFVASSALSPFLSNFQSRACDHLQWNVGKQLLQRSAEHFLQRSLDFHMHTSVTEMFNLMQKTFSIQGMGVTLLTQIIPTLIETAIASIILSCQFGALVGGSTALLIAAFTVCSVGITKKIISTREEATLAWNKTYDTIGDILSRYKLMRDCNQSEKAHATIEEALQHLKTIDLKTSKTHENAHMGYLTLSYLHMFFVSLYISKYSDAKQLIPLISYLGNFASLLPGFGHGMTRLFALYPDLKYVFSKLCMPPDIIDPYPDNPLVINRAPEITFKNVQFRYPSREEYLFQNLSFTIPSGAKVAFVSQSGAGKTSIFQLLYRYYAPDQGAILIDGQDISKGSLNSLQKQVCLLGQQAILFKGTIRENILYGASHPETIADDSLYALAESIGFRDFLSGLEEGLDTKVGEGGKALSGGQQQKVALLRSMLKTTKLRLLDEATASLDSLSASKMLDVLLDSSQDITTLMVTHKLTEARKAEIIFFLEDGEIIAQGSHEELLNTCNPYLKLWQLQEHQTTISP